MYSHSTKQPMYPFPVTSGIRSPVGTFRRAMVSGSSYRSLFGADPPSALQSFMSTEHAGIKTSYLLGGAALLAGYGLYSHRVPVTYAAGGFAAAAALLFLTRDKAPAAPPLAPPVATVTPLLAAPAPKPAAPAAPAGATVVPFASSTPEVQAALNVAQAAAKSPEAQAAQQVAQTSPEVQAALSSLASALPALPKF